jgi:hypothetical protein
MPPSRRLLAGGALFALAAAALLVPAGERAVPPAPASAAPFAWNRDSLWSGLAQTFAAARGRACADTAAALQLLADVEARVARLQAAPVTPESPSLDSLEQQAFAAAPLAAACAALVPRYVATSTRAREVIKAQSRAWDIGSVAARARLYRALYGSRAAVEEVLLQQPAAASPLMLSAITDSVAASASPSAVVQGVTLRSGDMLASRGGYPTSALIARGSDYPGNFSHIALVHVDSATHAVSVIEAHIEVGVAVSSAAAYLADKKLRVMVLRPRADLPQLRADPLLPHRAASAMLARARAGHIPYDFAMDYRDPSRLFCSEVASAAYATQGLTLWTGLSTISRPGLRRWLSSFGVEHFATQEPSDLEYDPQLHVVAEWHDPATLFADHVDNAVTDAMLDSADAGASLTFPWYALPAARVMKAYSWLRVQRGGHGPVPEGMAPAAALRNRTYGAAHAARAQVLRARAEAWTRTHGFPPPYWTLVELAGAPGR